MGAGWRRWRRRWGRRWGRRWWSWNAAAPGERGGGGGDNSQSRSEEGRRRREWPEGAADVTKQPLWRARVVASPAWLAARPAAVVSRAGRW